MVNQLIGCGEWVITLVVTPNFPYTNGDNDKYTLDSPRIVCITSNSKITYGTTNKEYGSTPHLQNIIYGKFSEIYQTGKGDIGHYTHSLYEEIGATPTTFYLANWKPEGFCNTHHNGAVNEASYISAYLEHGRTYSIFILGQLQLF